MARKRLLKNLTIDEISLVDDPANEHARAPIIKMRGDTDDAHSADDIERLRKALESFTRTGGSPEISAALAAMETDTMDMETLTKALEKAEASLKVLEKRAEKAEADLKDRDATIEKMKTEHAEAITKAKTPVDAAAAEAEFLKGLPESVRKQLADGKEAAEAVAKMKAERETDEFITKARDYNVGDVKEVGGMLYRISKGCTTADDLKTIETVLKAAGEQAKTAALYKAAGVSLPSSVDGDPEALLKAKAEEIQKANKGMTFAVAYDQALAENPTIYNAYIEKRRGLPAH